MDIGPDKVAKTGCLVFLTSPLVLLLASCGPCLCLVVFLVVSTGTVLKQELVWPVGVTPLAGGAGPVPAPGAEGSGYASYRSVGFEITSPYGWRTYLGEDLTPVPGHYEFHDGLDLAGPGLGFHDPVYPLLDGQPFLVGFYGHPPYYGGAGEAVIVWNVHTSEEVPVRLLYGHLEPYVIDVETYCPDTGHYVPAVPILVRCPREVVPEKGASAERTGPEGKVRLYNGTPGKCRAEVRWPHDFEPAGPLALEFDQQIDEAAGVACDALVRFYGCPREPTPTATATPTPSTGPAGGAAATPAQGIGGEAPPPAHTPTRLPSPTPPETAPAGTPSPTRLPSTPPSPRATETAGPPPTTPPLPPGPTHTPTRLPSPTHAPSPSPLPTAGPSPTLAPTDAPGPTASPWPTYPPGPTRPPRPTDAPVTGRPTTTAAPRPTSGPHDCPIGENLCYFPGFGPPITMHSELRQGRSVLGYIGMSGRTTGPHLHLALSLWSAERIDVLGYYRPREGDLPVPEERLHYANRYPEWIDPLTFLPQASGDEMGPAFADQPLQLPGPEPFIEEAGEGTWHSPGDVYSEGGGGRIRGWVNRLVCGWMGWLCRP